MSRKLTLDINFIDQPRDNDNFGYQISNNGVPLSFNGFDGWDKTFKEAADYSTTNASIMSFEYDLNPNVADNEAIGNGFNGPVSFIKRQSSGKYICVGNFTIYQNQFINKICRLNTDFTLDTTFIPPFYNNLITAIEIDSSDRIYLGVNRFVGLESKRMERLGVDGAFDSSYITGTGFNSDVTALKFQPDGKLLVGGWFSTFNGTTTKGLTRFTTATTATKDPTFNGVTTGFIPFSDSHVRSIDLQSTGNIVVGGDFVSYNGTTCGNIIILTPTGAIANVPVALSNLPGVIVGNVVNKVLVDSSNKIYVTGKFERYAVTNVCNKIIRLNSNGTYDSTFAVVNDGLKNGSSVFSTGGYDMIFNGSDNLVIIGGFTLLQDETVPNIGVLGNTGNISPDGETTAGTLDYFSDVIIRNIVDTGSGYIIVGDFDSYTTPNVGPVSSQFIIPLGVSSSNPGFDIGAGFATANPEEDNPFLNAIIETEDGGYLTTGFFTTYKGVGANRIVKLTATGSIDTSFVYGSGFDNFARCIVQADSGWLFAGNFTTYKGVGANKIVKLTATGSIDTSFVYGSGFNGEYVFVLKNTPDGGYILGGAFTTYKGVGCNRIVKLTATGSIDTSFVYGSGFSGFGNNVYAIENTPDGGYLIGGGFTTYNGTTANKIIKLTATGSVDTSFVYGSGFTGTFVQDILNTGDGYLIGGFFSQYNGVSTPYIVKVTATGSIDTSFVYGSGFDGIVYSMINTPDNNYLIGGGFASYKGISNNGLVKVTPTGSIDNTFVLNNPYSVSPGVIINTTDEGYLLGGYISDGTTSKGIVKLTSTGSIWSSTNIPVSSLQNTIQNTYDNLITYNNDYGIVYSKFSDKVRMIYEFDDQEIVINDVYDTPDYVEITYLNESLTLPELVDEIVVRSPYLIVSNTATFSSVNYKVKVYEGSIFNGPSQSITYDITKSKLFTGQENIYVNLNNLIRERLEANVTTFVDNQYDYAQTLPENMSKWCLVNETTFNGSVTASQTNYFLYALDGFLYNNEEQAQVPNVLVTGTKRYMHKDQPQRIYFQTNFLTRILFSVEDGYADYDAYWDSTDILGDNKKYIQSLQVDARYFIYGNKWADYTFIYSNSDPVTVRFEIYQDCKYKLYTIVYKNKWGVLESIPFSKKSTRGIDVKGVDFERSILDYNGNYDITRHTSKQFNVNASESWVLNTDWMPEYMNAAFEELGLSEEVWIITDTNEIIPVIKEDTRIDFKTVLNDKLIQYTLKVKLSHQVIKNIL